MRRAGRRRANPFTVYIDDSGSGGVLWNWDGTPADFSKSPPVLNVTALAVSEHAKQPLTDRWTQLRSKIGVALGANPPPSIHMRLMFGPDKNIDKPVRGRRNPYALATREQRLAWIEEANAILFDSMKSGEVFAVTVGHAKDEMAENWRSYYTSREFLDDYAFLRTRNRHALEAFHKVACNSHLTALSHLVFGLNRIIVRFGDPRARLVYDQNPLSRGFDVITALRLLQRRGRLANITAIDESGEEASPLLQAADVVANRDHKIRMSQFRVSKGQSDPTEPIVFHWHRDYPIRFLTLSGLQKQERSDALSVHYELARMAAAEVDPAFAELHLVTVEEFMRRSQEGHRNNHVGISVRKSK